MIAAILTAAGYKVGLYTSPHLLRFNERIRINGKMILNSDVEVYTKKLKPVLQQVKGTFFEATTVIALQYFADQKVDIAILETGLGGRLDATNVVRPKVSVITSIGLDHTEQLGSTIVNVASEKGGIIKHKVPVVLGNVNNAAHSVLVRMARQKQCPIIESSNIVMPENVLLDLKGSFQIDNARCAVAAIHSVRRSFPVTDEQVLQGLVKTTRLTGIHGRFEMYPQIPRVLIDVAHNPDAMDNLVRAIRQLKEKAPTIVFGIMKDKDIGSVLNKLKKLHGKVIVTQPAVERAARASVLFDRARVLGFHVIAIPNVENALRYSKKVTPKNGLIIICGSHYLAGESIPFIKKWARQR